MVPEGTSLWVFELVAGAELVEGAATAVFVAGAEIGTGVYRGAQVWSFAFFSGFASSGRSVFSQLIMRILW